MITDGLTDVKVSLEDDEFKVAFLEGNLAIDCLKITLTQNGTDDPRSYELVGSLFVNPDEGVTARLVWERDAEHSYDPFAPLDVMQQIQLGNLFPESHYFSLRAVDIAGRRWTHPAVFLKREEWERVEILTVSCDSIQVESETTDKSTLAHFVFHEELGIEVNSAHSSTAPVRNRRREVTKRTAAKGSIGPFEIDYYPVLAHKLGNAHELSAVTNSKNPVPNHFDERLLEAVQFSVAKLAWPIMREVIQGGKQIVTLSKSTPFNNGHVQPAVPGYAEADFYRLMGCYYQYACLAAKGDGAPPLSKTLRGLFTLKGVWLDTIALLLAVSVESLLNDPVYKEFGAPDEEGRRKIQELIAYVTKASFDRKLTERAANVMGGMMSSSASDKLHVLAKAGVIDEEDIKAWKAIRNAAAHGGLKVDLSSLKNALAQVNRLVAMTYKLVFLRIGYQGKYVDYATSGWPTAQFDAVKCKEQLDKLSEQSNLRGQEIER